MPARRRCDCRLSAPGYDVTQPQPRCPDELRGISPLCRTLRTCVPNATLGVSPCREKRHPRRPRHPALLDKLVWPGRRLATVEHDIGHLCGRLCHFPLGLVIRLLGDPPLPTASVQGEQTSHRLLRVVHAVSNSFVQSSPLREVVTDFRRSVLVRGPSLEVWVRSTGSQEFVLLAVRKPHQVLAETIRSAFVLDRVPRTKSELTPQPSMFVALSRDNTNSIYRCHRSRRGYRHTTPITPHTCPAASTFAHTRQPPSRYLLAARPIDGRTMPPICETARLPSV